MAAVFGDARWSYIILVIMSFEACFVQRSFAYPSLPFADSGMEFNKDIRQTCGTTQCYPEKECCGRVFGQSTCLRRPGPGDSCDPKAPEGCSLIADFCECQCVTGYICRHIKTTGSRASGMCIPALRFGDGQRTPSDVTTEGTETSEE